jgi:hypothetical protein
MSRNLPPRYLDFLYGTPLQPGQVLGSPASGTGPLQARAIAQTDLPVTLNVVYLQAGTSTYTPSSWAKVLFIEAFGAGGGGGGSHAGASQASCSGGGGAGAYSTKLITSPKASYTVVVGSGGSGGVGANNGGTGGATQFDSPPICQAAGGTGGNTDGGGTATTTTLGGTGASFINGTGDLTLNGSAGGPGLRVSGTVGISGAGAAGPLGGQTAGVNTTTGGNTDPSSPGCGGSGACTLNGGADQTGGSGTPGLYLEDADVGAHAELIQAAGGTIPDFPHGDNTGHRATSVLR